MKAFILAAALWLAAFSAYADCKTFSDIAEDMMERFPAAYLHSGPIEGEKATYYVWAAEGVPTLLVFAFVDGCFTGYFEVSNSRLFGSMT